MRTTTRGPRPLHRLAAAAAVLLLAWLVREVGFDSAAGTTAAPPPIGLDESAGAERIEQAFARRESGFQVTVDAIVAKTLRDDLTPTTSTWPNARKSRPGTRSACTDNSSGTIAAACCIGRTARPTVIIPTAGSNSAASRSSRFRR